MKFEDYAREASRALAALGRSADVPSVSEMEARRRRRGLVLGSTGVAILAVGTVAVMATVGGPAGDDGDLATGSTSRVSVPAATVPVEGGGVLFGPPRIGGSDTVEFPITLLDGTRLSLTLPQSLAADIQGLVPGGGAGWELDPCCGRSLDVIYGSVEDVYGDRQPDVTYVDADGNSVGFYTEEDDLDYLVFQYGSWLVRAWDGDPEGQRFSEGNRAMFASLMRGHETADGFLVLDPAEPMSIRPTDSPDATFTTSTPGEGVVGVFKWRDCTTEGPSANPDLVTSAGNLVSFAQGSGMTSICFPEGSLYLWVSRLDLTEAELEVIDLTYTTGQPDESPLTTLTTTSTTSSTTTTLPDDSELLPFGPLGPRGGTSAVWTGEEMIVWGGCDTEQCQTRFTDGAAFNPGTEEWRMIAESPLDGLWNLPAVWTGTEMLIVRGLSAAAYSPDSDSWRVLPDAPFRISFRRPDGSGSPDYVGAVWADDRYVIWAPGSDEVAAYEPESDSWVGLPSTGLDVDLGVLRWNGTDLVALGALTGVYPDRVPLRGARLIDGAWERVPDAELWDETYNIGARPFLSGWAGDTLVAWPDSGSGAGRTRTYTLGAAAWSEIETIPLQGSEAWPEPMQIGDRLIALQYGRAAIYDSASGSWTVVNIPFISNPEAGRAVWTGNEILYWAGDPARNQAWRYAPPD